MSWNEEFTEPIVAFQSEEGSVMVAFARHAGLYRLAAEREDFAQQLAVIGAAWQSNRPLRAVVRGQQIVSVQAT
jgi:hypothetical protein